MTLFDKLAILFIIMTLIFSGLTFLDSKPPGDSIWLILTVFSLLMFFGAGVISYLGYLYEDHKFYLENKEEIDKTAEELNTYIKEFREKHGDKTVNHALRKKQFGYLLRTKGLQ